VALGAAQLPHRRRIRDLRTPQFIGPRAHRHSESIGAAHALLRATAPGRDGADGPPLAYVDEALTRTEHPAARGRVQQELELLCSMNTPRDPLRRGALIWFGTTLPIS